MTYHELIQQPNGMLVYRYGNSEMDFEFSMMCEVGAPYQQWFVDEILRRGYKVDYGRELNAYPYCADFVEKQNNG